MRRIQRTLLETNPHCYNQVTTTQKLASDAQIEKMEKELAKMRAQLTESVQLMEQREMNTNIECVILFVSSYCFPSILPITTRQFGLY